MRRTVSLLAGALAFALVPALAQQAQQPAATAVAGNTGKVHGRITNPTGAPQSGGTVTFMEGSEDKATLNVDADGNYSGDVPAGTYSLIYRSTGMAKDKQADRIDNVKVVPGQDNVLDDDMSRQEYIDKMPEDQKKQLEELKKNNAAATQANAVIKNLNSDLKVVAQDLKDADGAHAAAVEQLGANAAKADVDAKTNEIKTQKYTDADTVMTKDTQLRPQEPVLWAYLGQAQAGEKKYDQAETSFKKALELDAASKKPNPAVQGMANAGLGEVYARAGKVPEANAAYDAAAKANPTSAGMYYRNQAVIFFQSGNGDAQVAAADVAIKNDPNDAMLYYLKGQGLIQKASYDAKAQKIILPPGCADAYQKYLELAPNGPYAGEVAGILQQAGQKVSTSYKAGTKK